jgi:hypothetical protein
MNLFKRKLKVIPDKYTIKKTWNNDSLTMSLHIGDEKYCEAVRPILKGDTRANVSKLVTQDILTLLNQ